MKISKNDFIELCDVETPASWDNFSITDEGVFVKRLDAHQDALIAPSVRKDLERHPTGDPRLPALVFPCYLDDLEKFLAFYGLSSYLQQHTLLAWQTEKQGDCKRANEEDSKLYWKYLDAIDAVSNFVSHNPLALLLSDWLKKETERETLLPTLTLEGLELPIAADLYKRLQAIQGAAEKLARLVHGKKSPSPSYQTPIYDRLEPKTDWRGGYMSDTDVLTLDDAAKFATKHSGEEVTPSDILRAAGRGQIHLKAIIHRTAKVQRYDGGIYCNKGQENENMAPAGAIASLPQSACKHLAATGRATWRTFDGFELIDGVWCRYTKGLLVDGEPDFETSVADCRVTGREVHALADELCDSTETRDVNVSRKDGAPETDASKGTPPKLSNDQQNEVVQLYARGHGWSVNRLAVRFRVSRPTIDKVLKKARVKI